MKTKTAVTHIRPRDAHAAFEAQTQIRYKTADQLIQVMKSKGYAYLVPNRSGKGKSCVTTPHLLERYIQQRKAVPSRQVPHYSKLAGARPPSSQPRRLLQPRDGVSQEYIQAVSEGRL